MAANVLVQQIYILSKLAICSQCSDHAEQWAGLWYFLAQISSVQQLQHLLLKQQQQLLWSAVAATAWHCCLCCAAVAISRARAVVDAITEVYCCFAVMAWDVVAKQLWCTKLHWTIAFAFWMQYGIVLIHPQRLFVLHDLHSILRNSFWSSLGNHRLVSNTLQRICCPG